jgi:hypothetical protein
MRELLEQAGFRVRGQRANCMHCQGTSRFTVAFNDSVAFCHRCKWTANARLLGKKLGRTVSPESSEQRRIRLVIAQFRAWLSAKYTKMANEERQLASRAQLAKKLLAVFPGCEPAWNALARWHHAEQRLQNFFELAQCRSGRRELFREWVRANAARG